MHSILKVVFPILIIALVAGCNDERAKIEPEEVSDKPGLIPVTLENYEVAETDLAFNNVTKVVGTNQFLHFPLDAFDLKKQAVVRMNQDTVYSVAVVNASAGATVTLPATDGRYMTAMIAQNDHYVDQVFKTAGEHVIESDTDFVGVIVRIGIDMNDPDDKAKVQALRDAISVDVKATEPHVFPNYDLDQLVSLRKKLAAEAAEYGSLNNMQGARGTVDKHMHILGTAAGWGLFPDANALWAGRRYRLLQSDLRSASIQRARLFSITMYDADGWLFSEHAILSKYNNEFNDDGTFDVLFGDCGADAKNNLPIVDGWNFLMRIYEPRLDELDGYTLPTPVKAN